MDPLLLAFTLWIGIILAVSPSHPVSVPDVALAKNMATMHSEMEKVQYSGSSDVDFARMMVAHHQGAIEMTKVELQFGRDLRMRRLAQEILVTQQSEIGVMNGVLKEYDDSSISPKRNNWCTPWKIDFDD